MSDKVSDNLTKERMQQLLASVGSRPMPQEEKIEAEEYDWARPHYFSNEQFKKVEDFAKKTSVAIAEKFRAFYNADFEVTVPSVTEHYATVITNKTDDANENDYYLVFNNGAKQFCGFVRIPYQSALRWATGLLGDSEAQGESERVLSQLEESLLLDVASSFVKALFIAERSCDFKPADELVKANLAVELDSSSQFSEIAFEIKKAETEDSDKASIFILSSNLNEVVGRSSRETVLSAEENRKAIIESFNQFSITVTAQLDSAMLNFEDAIGLQPGDILLLDKKLDEGAEVMVQGRRLFYGRLAKNRGSKALVITG
jgi:flagellar motor switch protein FliM